MTREEQLKELAKVWIDCGGGRTVVYRGLAAGFYHYDKRIVILHNAYAIGSYYQPRFLDIPEGEPCDIEDASPTLAILQNVKGEDAELHRAYDHFGPNQSLAIMWMAFLVKKNRLIGESLISRIHAVTLALKDKST